MHRSPLCPSGVMAAPIILSLTLPTLTLVLLEACASCRASSRQSQHIWCIQVDHPAVDVVQARLRGGSKPGKRKDSHKVGLVVEGGGMRGVVTGAALQAMHDLGMRFGSASCPPPYLCICQIHSVLISQSFPASLGGAPWRLHSTQGAAVTSTEDMP